MNSSNSQDESCDGISCSYNADFSKGSDSEDYSIRRLG